MKKIFVFCLIVSMLFSVSCSRELYRTGDVDYYYEEGYRLSSYHTAREVVYSVEFVKKFEALDSTFHYYVEPSHGVAPFGEYDVVIISITYSAENYELAKQDLLNNTTYISEEPNYMHNGYDFYKVEWYHERKLFVHAFNDTQNIVVLMGMYISGTFDINLNVPEDEWPEFLRTYYGEYYDFDA